MPSKRQYTVILSPLAAEVFRRRRRPGESLGETMSRLLLRYDSLTIALHCDLSVPELSHLAHVLDGMSRSPTTGVALAALIDGADVPDSSPVIKSKLVAKLQEAGLAGRLAVLDAMEQWEVEGQA